MSSKDMTWMRFLAAQLSGVVVALTCREFSAGVVYWGALLAGAVFIVWIAGVEWRSRLDHPGGQTNGMG